MALVLDKLTQMGRVPRSSGVVASYYCSSDGVADSYSVNCVTYVSYVGCVVVVVVVYRPVAVPTVMAVVAAALDYILGSNSAVVPNCCHSIVDCTSPCCRADPSEDPPSHP